MRRLPIVLLLVALAGCGAPPVPPTAQSVLAGLPVESIRPVVREADSPLPNSYKEHVEFIIPSLGDKGGQMFVCESKQLCDPIYAYYDALKALAGPYIYQSPNGLVVMQLNNGRTPDEAKPFEAAVANVK